MALWVWSSTLLLSQLPQLCVLGCRYWFSTSALGCGNRTTWLRRKQVTSHTMDLNIKEMEGYNKNEHGQDEVNAMHWGYICSNPAQMSGSKWVSCSVQGGECDSSWHRGPSNDGGHSSAPWLKASREAEITTGRKEKWEKEKVSTTNQEIVEKSLILTLKSQDPTIACQVSAAKMQPLMTLDAKRQKSTPFHKKLCLLCQQPDSATLAVHTSLPFAVCCVTCRSSIQPWVSCRGH